MQKRTLLLIDGNQIVMDANLQVIESAGYSVTCAVDAECSLKLLEESAPDAIILSKNLPDGCGIEFLRELRIKGITTPIMLMSDRREDEVVALQNGADDFQRKPYDFDVILARINRMIKDAERIDQKKGSDDADNESTEREVRGVLVNVNHCASCEYVDGAEKELLELTRLPRYTRSQKTAAAFCAVLVLVAGLFGIFGSRTQGARGPVITVEDEFLPLGETPDLINDGEGTPVLSDHDIDISSLGTVTIPIGATMMDIFLHNPETNNYNFIFEIVLKDSEETLFMSDKVAPGERIGRVSITRVLPEGQHDALLKIRTFDVRDGTPNGMVHVDFFITVM